jgi:hypothetical protein
MARTGRLDALVVGRQEAHQRREQQRGVEPVGAVVLGEHAALVEAVRQHVGVDLVGDLLPRRRLVLLAAHPRQARPAVAGHPAHDLRRGEVLGLAAHLPDAAVGLAPVQDRLLDLVAQDRPEAVGQPVARLRVQVERVEDRAPHVVLAVRVGAVADPHRPGALVAVEVVEDVLSRLRSPPMPYITCRSCPCRPRRR